MAIRSTSIFPNSVSDVDAYIASMLGPVDQIHVSCVNRKAHDEVLTNDTFFKQQFDCQYPHLAKLKNAFKFLSDNHPTICWKVACRVLSATNPSYHLPQFSVECLKSQKKRWELELNQLQGSSSEDSQSPLFQARKAYRNAVEKAHKELEELDKESAPHIEAIKTQHTPEEIHALTTSLCSNLGESVCNSLEKGLSLFLLKPILLPSYRAIVKLKKTINQLQNEMNRLELQYNQLERHREAIKARISQLDDKLEKIASNGQAFEQAEQEYANILLQELTIWSGFNNYDFFDKCFTAISGLVAKPIKVNSDALMQIQKLINSSPAGKDIWQKLYLKCANGVQEDRWAEIHFSEFLPHLLEIVRDKYEDSKQNRSSAGNFYMTQVLSLENVRFSSLPCNHLESSSLTNLNS